MFIMNNELNPATVSSLGVHLQVLKCQVIESQQLAIYVYTLFLQRFDAQMNTKVNL